MVEEKRRSPRRTVKVELRSDDDSGVGDLLWEGVDLSLGGAFIHSDLLLEQGERLTLRLTLPGATGPIQAEAEVAWVRRFPKDGELPGMGVRFLNLSEADRAALDQFLRSLT